jgi:hypothetical protein
VNVTFEVGEFLCTLSEPAVRVVQARLRLIGEGGILMFSVDRGLMGAAAAVADVIDESLSANRAEPIPLQGKAAEAVYNAARTGVFSAEDQPSAAGLMEGLRLLMYGRQEI